MDRGNLVERVRRRLLQVLAHYNFCEVLIFAGAEARHKFGGIMFLIGHKDDAQVVRMIHDHVLTQIGLLRKRALRHLHAPKLQIKMTFFGPMVNQVPQLPYGAKLRQWNDAFYMGIVDGIYLALKNQRYQAEQDETTRAIVKYADAKTREFIANNIGDLKEKKDQPKEVKDLNAYIAGRVAADMIEVDTGEEPQPRVRYLEEKTDG